MTTEAPEQLPERYAGQVARAIAAGLGPITVESVRLGAYSDQELAELIERQGHVPPPAT